MAESGLTAGDFARRLNAQQQALLRLISEPRTDDLARQPSPGVWSAREHLAHLGRYHEVFRERLARMRAEDAPSVGRYRAPEDPGFAAWASLPYADIMSQLAMVRAQLLDDVTSLTAQELARMGSHPLFGEVTIADWLEFFLVHEGHHHYVLLVRLREAEHNR
jgi:uncharacterized damage-inducible protein DinB